MRRVCRPRCEHHVSPADHDDGLAIAPTTPPASTRSPPTSVHQHPTTPLVAIYRMAASLPTYSRPEIVRGQHCTAGEAGNPGTQGHAEGRLVSRRDRRPPAMDDRVPTDPAPQDLFLIRHIRGMRSGWSSEGRPAYGVSEIDRGCPLGTGIDPSMWHANGTTSEARPGRPASLPGAIGRSFLRAEDLVLAVPGLFRSPCRVWLSPRPRS